jgi:transcriptional regulator NrdR family protein
MSVTCLQCGCHHCPVTHSTEYEYTFRGKKHTMMRRRRVCRHCGRVFYTKEAPEEPEELKDKNGKALPQKTPPGDNPFI